MALHAHSGLARHLPWRTKTTGVEADIFIIAAIVIAALYFGKDLLVPLAFAVLLSFILTPLVRLLQKLRLPKSASVIAVILLAFSMLAAATMLLANQVPDLAGKLPLYETALAKKIKSLRGSAMETSVLERASETIKDLGKEIADDKKKDDNKVVASPTNPATAQEVMPPRGTPTDPLVVAIAKPAASMLETYQSIISMLVPPLAMTLLVFLYATFILLQRRDLRDRFIRLAGGDLERTTTAMIDAGQRLSRFFLMQAVINSVYGLVIGLALWAIGVPNAVLWGGLAFLMRYVPYVGSLLAAAFPLILAAAVDPTWSMFYMTAALYAIGEGMMGQVVEPLALGRSTGLSPFAFIVAATFWTALWGPIGLVLATPLTSILVVLGRHVDRLRFLDVLLGDQPALSNDEMLYQRLLAGDPEEATEQAETYLKKHSLLAYYDNVALAALRLAQLDAERGVLAKDKLETMALSVSEIIDDLSHIDDKHPDPDGKSDGASSDEGAAEFPKRAGNKEAEPLPDLPVADPGQFSPAWRERGTVLCVSGRSPLDRAAAGLLVQLLEKHGLDARAIPYTEMSALRLKSADPGAVGAIVLSYMGLGKRIMHLKSLVKRARGACPEALIIAGLWSEPEPKREREPDRAADGNGAARRAGLDVDARVATLREAVEKCLATAIADDRAPSHDSIAPDLENLTAS